VSIKLLRPSSRVTTLLVKQSTCISDFDKKHLGIVGKHVFDNIMQKY
jgi:hypothetical protein